ncbi:unnamed protein product [marine sediment metagenome]|uniref:AAA domain-containing protein n=1 Tax=marine sediment metagenome TaxID=412755 RepID=X1GUM7_9ZZZZ
MELKDKIPAKLESAMIDPNERIEEDIVCLKIIERTQYIPVLTLGNFSAIIGKAKSRKSFFGILILGVMIAGKIMFNKFYPKINSKKVILFDTEQGKARVQKSVQRVIEIAKTHENFTAYSLRPFSVEERIQMIEFAIYNTDNIGFVLLDGVRDLVTDINSPEQASKISNLLMKWTGERNIHIMVVIHQNKADLSARGHIGTEIVNKSETVISITKDSVEKYKSLITPEFTRDIDFEPFSYYIKDGIPCLLEEEVEETMTF